MAWDVQEMIETFPKEICGRLTDYGKTRVPFLSTLSKKYLQVYTFRINVFGDNVWKIGYLKLLY